MRYHKTILLSVPGLVLGSTLVWARVLPEFDPIAIEPGERVEQVIEIERDSGARVQIRLVSYPEDARIVVNDDGQMVLVWESGPVIDDETDIVIQVTNVDTQAVIDTATLSVLNVHSLDESVMQEFVDDEEPELNAGTPVVTTSIESHAQSSVDGSAIVEPVQDTDADEYERPVVYLNRAASQIVSAGRNVSMRFNGESSDGKKPVLSIDRLPRNASFEENISGGYTFFWQTNDRDQGEHVFRITATHPSDTSESDSARWTVVVGDPTRSRTQPQEFADSGD